ncbi:membrane-spanning 4-domains subfamily A member 4D-like isoform X1 [Paralichthys olivaceus]|uniref:membrane-spanning 4-domains subfamily A member 4D-like isoform X1 n=1 Tax=Paralichthys olivaceus TaxID=8255 RepID=UPI00097DF0AE|nr:PREDICTED: membrane-spanning 4-domains subfamily A member 8-like [Paralichthys olivaceus]XP_019952259.1 PREDICTED: membrane-spanning 4-domains subfamily A member 8-like [Paralichthys olivaceus]XP_019952260.1 PREDICTED: membrane-spanning 4-domains subfamily A member 8-like [Paralichthys olivaceus]XP_019952261.1 PREDICTED: membrane-spanning 4-domains subfamily A member 8-like [Paralichthys olivaceus]
MSSTMYTTAEGVMVVTHVHPPAPVGDGLPQCVGIRKFSKNQPNVLGTIQIIVGLTVLLFGIVTVINADSLGAFSGFFVWGPLVYITAGSLTVAAGRYLKRCLVNAAMALCVIAALFSTTGTILYSLDAAGILSRCYSSDSFYPCYLYQSRSQGFSGVLAFFNLLELIVSIVVAGLACNASCHCCGEPSTVFVYPQASASPVVPAAAQPVPQLENNFNKPQLPGASGQTQPPTYDSVIG